MPRGDGEGALIQGTWSIAVAIKRLFSGEKVMACREKNKIVPFLTDNLDLGAKEKFVVHLGSCRECRVIMESYRETEGFLKDRSFPEVPLNLARDCMRRIDEQAGHGEKSVRFSRKAKPFIIWPRPIWQFALVVIVFCGGLGLGKILFDKPNDIVWPRSAQADKGNGNGQRLRNYLLSIETLFLDLSNMENTTTEENGAVTIEREMVYDLLEKTRTMKRFIKNRNPVIYKLVTDIEWVLDDFLGALELELNDFTGDIRRTIEDNQLLVKIHSYTS